MTAWVAILFLAGLALADDRPRLWVARRAWWPVSA